MMMMNSNDKVSKMTKFKIGLMQWAYILTPLFIGYFTFMLYNAYTQQNNAIDRKAEKVIVDAMCDMLDTKVDNQTLLEMLETLKQKDNMLDRVNDEQSKRLDYQKDIQYKQLEVLKNIEVQMGIMNAGRP